MCRHTTQCFSSELADDIGLWLSPSKWLLGGAKLWMWLGEVTTVLVADAESRPRLYPCFRALLSAVSSDQWELSSQTNMRLQVSLWGQADEGSLGVVASRSSYLTGGRG